MRVISSTRGRSRPVRTLVGLVTAVVIALTGLAITSPAVRAADTDVVAIPDANLKAAVNAAIGGARTPTQDVTEADARGVTVLLSQHFTGPVADLTGLQAFTNLTQLGLSSTVTNTVSSLAPLSGLTRLTSLTLTNAQVTDLSPLTGLAGLTALTLSANLIKDVSPLASLTNLTNLQLANNQIRDLTKFPSGLTNLAVVVLSTNNITNVAPLVDKLNPAVLSTLNLDSNKITDASPLAAYGLNGGKLGTIAPVSQGLKLRYNRIADFSAFSGWTRVPATTRVSDQTVYVGPYQASGVTITLKAANGVVPAVSPAVGAYDPATSKLTVIDPTAPNVVVTPNWTVAFANPPIDVTDGPIVSGAPQAGQRLQVTDVGPDFDGTTCAEYSYRWLRDGEPFVSSDYFNAGSPLGSDYTVMGGGGDNPNGWYFVSATDVGHRLQVRVTCVATGTESTSAPTALVTTSVPEQPVGQFLIGPSSYSGTDGSVNGVSVSGVVGDPTNPTMPIHLAQTNAAGTALVDATQLTVTVAVSYPDYVGPELRGVTQADVQVTGDGADRTVEVTPTGLTQAGTITLTVTGTTGQTTNLTFRYGASIATTPTSRVLLGSSDASTSIAVGDGYLMVADDEKHNIRLYDPSVSGREVAQFAPYRPNQNPSDEIDFESSARRGDTIWWFGSHGNKKDGTIQGTRQSIFETTLTGSGADATLTPVGNRYAALRRDLVAWDQLHGGRFGFTSLRGAPDGREGFNIEGAEFSPDDSELYLGFRSPVVPATTGGNALIVPVENLEALTSGAASQAQFGEPILLDLGGDSIREIRKNGRDEYLVLSAPAGIADRDLPSQQTLWAWNGEPDSAPRRLTTEVPQDVEQFHSDNPGAWEGIGEMPDRLASGAEVRLLMDQGYDSLYGPGGDNKDDSNDWSNKARTDTVTLTGPVGTVAGLSEPGAFPDQVVNSIGSAREVTVTNTGSNLLHVDDVFTADHDSVSADDFLVSGDTCSGKTLDLDETCTIRVRFAPSRAGTTSDAELVVESDVPGGSTTVALSGTAVAAPPTGGGGGGGGTTPPQKAVSTVGAGSVTVPSGQPASISVQVTGAAATQPTGTVTLRNGGQTVGTATLASGSASITVPAGSLTTGGNLFTVEYAGDSAYSGSSAPVMVTVTTAPQKGSSVVSADSVAVDLGRSAPIAVQVTGTSGTTPTGTVTLHDGGRTVGTAQLSQGGARITVPADTLSVGVNLFTVEYAGDSAYNGSGSPVIVTVDKAAAKVTAKPAGKVVAKKKAALKVSVTGPAGITPTGMVTVLVDGRATTVRLVNGQATVRPTFKTAGTRSVFLTYAGNGDLSEASATVKVKVTPAKKKKHQHGRASGLTRSAWQAKAAPVLN